MMPQFMPTNSFSAFCENFTSSTISMPRFSSSFRMTAISTSMDAEEESPAPFGSVP